MEVISNEEAKILTESYRLGCLMTGKTVYMNDILDLINTVKAARSINLLSRIIIEGRLPIIFDNKKLDIITDKKDSLITQ